MHPKSLKGSIKYQELSIKTFNMKELSISALNQSLKNKDFTSVELTEYFLKRISDAKRFNLDEESIFIELDEKMLNG